MREGVYACGVFPRVADGPSDGYARASLCAGAHTKGHFVMPSAFFEEGGHQYALAVTSRIAGGGSREE